MDERGAEGWVWDPDVRLVREEDGVEIDLDFTVRVFSGRFQAEYAWVYVQPARTGIAQFRDWNRDAGSFGHIEIPVYSPQWAANDRGGVDAGNEVGRGARLIIPGDRDYEHAKALLEAAYELDS